MFLLWPFKLVFRLVELAVSAAVLYVIVTAVQVALAASTPSGATAPANAPKAAAIVVLGAAPSSLPGSGAGAAGAGAGAAVGSGTAASTNGAAAGSPAASTTTTVPTENGAGSGTDEPARLAEAHALVRAGLAPRLVVAANSQLSTALSTLAPWISSIPGFSLADEILADDAATQLRLAASKLGASPAHPVHVIVVTDAVDALWTRHAAAEDGLAATIVAPAGLPVAVRSLGPLLRETSAVAVGRIIGFGRVTWA